MSNTPGGARRAPPSRPTTPLRPLSGSSLRASSSHRTGGNGFRGGDIEADDLVTGVDRLETTLEPQFADLAEGMADLEANLIHLQLQHESLARFAESFASFLYGMEVNAFCVDFPEVSFISLCRPNFRFLYYTVRRRSSRVLKPVQAPVLESFIRARSSEVETGKIIVNPSHDNDTDATFLYVIIF